MASNLARSIKYNNSVHGTDWGLPPQMIAQTEKEKPEWQEACMDYFDYISGQQSSQGFKDIKKLNYLSGQVDMKAYKKSAHRLLGVSKPTDGANKADAEVDITDFVHYPIMVRPFNTIIGEYIKRIAQLHGFYVKNESDYARNEYIRVKTDILREWATQKIMQRVNAKVKASGVKEGTDEFQQAVQQQTPEDIQDFMDRDYTDIAETINSTLIKNMWQTESLDSEFIDGFKSACALGKEFFHIYRVNNKTKIKNLYSPEVFYHKSASNKWISEGQYAGFRSWFTPSSVIDMFYDTLTIEDFEQIEAAVNPNVKSDRNANKKGIASISYDTQTFADFAGNVSGYLNATYDMVKEYQMYGNSDAYTRQTGLVKVVRAYWKSYRPIGWLTSYDESDDEVIDMVDENYEADKDRGEVVKLFPQIQIYTGAKILDNIYKDVRPYNDQIIDLDNLEYNPLPIEGCLYSDNNTEPYSLFDLMLPWNELYDEVAAELKEDMNSSLGRVLFMSIDHIPNMPGFDMNKWYYWVKKFKIAWVKQPKNGPNTFNQFSSADMSFAQQIAAKMDALDRIMINCDAFAGFAPGRIVGQSSTQTLGESNQQVAASVNQTEYLFFKHSKLIQRVLNQALNLSRKNLKDNTFIRNLFDDYQLSYIDYDPDMVSNAKLSLYTTNSSEDLRKRQMMESLMQPAMQNGADFTDMSELIMAETLSEVRTLGHKLRRKAAAAQQAQQQNDQRVTDVMQQNAKLHEDNIVMLTREKLRSQEKQTYMKTFGGANASPEDDADNSGVPDILEYEKFNLQQQDLFKKHSLATRKQVFEEKKHTDTMKLERDRLSAEKQRTHQMAAKKAT